MLWLISVFCVVLMRVVLFGRVVSCVGLIKCCVDGSVGVCSVSMFDMGSILVSGVSWVLVVLIVW